MPNMKSTYVNTIVNLPTGFPEQHQDEQPGLQKQMNPAPVIDNPAYHGAGKLSGRVAVITGGDSGIGQAVAIAFAKEGADVAVAFYNEQEDAAETVKKVEEVGRRCILVKGDLRQEAVSGQVADTAVKELGHIDILVNNIAVQYPQNSIKDITAEQLYNTFATNIFSYFYMTKAVLPHLNPGSAIINTTSITAYKGAPDLLDYSSTKGAIVSFTRSLALSLVTGGIRVNAVAPGPIWTPLIPSSYSKQKVAKHGQDVPMARSGQPFELAPTYVYLASEDSGYVTGQVLHVNGGVITDS